MDSLPQEKFSDLREPSRPRLKNTGGVTRNGKMPFLIFPIFLQGQRPTKQ